MPMRRTGNCYKEGRGLSLAHVVGEGIRLLVLRISGEGFARSQLPFRGIEGREIGVRMLGSGFCSVELTIWASTD